MRNDRNQRLDRNKLKEMTIIRWEKGKETENIKNQSCSLAFLCVNIALTINKTRKKKHPEV